MTANFLASETDKPFLKVFAPFERLTISESIYRWQTCRTVRNLVARDYETNCALPAEHFKELHGLQLVLIRTTKRLLALCAQSLKIVPTTADSKVKSQSVGTTIASGVVRTPRDGVHFRLPHPTAESTPCKKLL